MDPVQKMWMFYQWMEDEKEKSELAKNHAYLLGSFTNPEAVKKLMGGGNSFDSSDEDFEESTQIVSQNKIVIPELQKNAAPSVKRRKRRSLNG
jgi:hypothetical protein